MKIVDRSWPVGFAWFLATWFATYGNTHYLIILESATTLTFVRFIGSAIFGICTNKICTVWTKNNVRTLLSSSFYLLLANFFNSLALELSGITLTNVVKSTIPLCTVFTCFLQGQTIGWPVLQSIVITAMGVALASYSDNHFTVSGLFAAIASTVFQTLLNVKTKENMASLEISGIESQFLSVSLCSIILTPVFIIWAHLEFGGIYPMDFPSIEYATAKAVVIAVVSYHLEYVLNFILFPLLSEISFSLIDLIRRLSVIAVGSYIFDKPLSIWNWLGVFIAFHGVWRYQLHVGHSVFTQMQKMTSEDADIEIEEVVSLREEASQHSID